MSHYIKTSFTEDHVLAQAIVGAVPVLHANLPSAKGRLDARGSIAFNVGPVKVSRGPAPLWPWPLVAVQIIIPIAHRADEQLRVVQASALDGRNKRPLRTKESGCYRL